MGNAPARTELAASVLDVSKKLDFLQHVFIFLDIEDDRGTVAPLRQDQRPLPLPDLLDETRGVRPKLGERPNILNQVRSHHMYLLWYVQVYHFEGGRSSASNRGFRS